MRISELIQREIISILVFNTVIWKTLEEPASFSDADASYKASGLSVMLLSVP